MPRLLTTSDPRYAFFKDKLANHGDPLGTLNVLIAAAHQSVKVSKLRASARETFRRWRGAKDKGKPDYEATFAWIISRLDMAEEHYDPPFEYPEYPWIPPRWKEYPQLDEGGRYNRFWNEYWVGLQKRMTDALGARDPTNLYPYTKPMGVVLRPDTDALKLKSEDVWIALSLIFHDLDGDLNALDH